MRLITNEELLVVAGGDSDLDWGSKPIIKGEGDPDLGAWDNIGGFDAAATRSSGQNSWGEPGPATQPSRPNDPPLQPINFITPKGLATWLGVELVIEILKQNPNIDVNQDRGL